MDYLRAAPRSTGRLAELEAEVAALRARVECLTSENQILRTRLAELGSRRPYGISLRLKVLWHMEYFRVARRTIRNHLGIPRCTLYRWLHRFEKGEPGKHPQGEPANKTPCELAGLVWEMFMASPHWGRRHIAMTIQALGIFIAASTVRNILIRRKPKTAPVLPAIATVRKAVRHTTPRRVVARYPNHVWSGDRTRVHRWGIWPTWVLVAVDHFSRKLVLLATPSGNEGGAVEQALEYAFVSSGTPKHLITDREGVFRSETLSSLLARCNVSHRVGAVGQSGSISVTERAIWTLKYEWLRRVPMIRGLDHLNGLPAAAKGFWEADNVFVVELDEIGNINHWRVTMTFEDERALVVMHDETGLGEVELVGRVKK
jgi:transposase